MRTQQVQTLVAGVRGTSSVILNDELYVERDIEPIILDRLKRKDFIHQPLAVVGEPGVGKSSLLWSLVQRTILEDTGGGEAWLLDAQDLLDYFGDNRSGSRGRFSDFKRALGYFSNETPPVLFIDTADAVLNRRDDTLIFKDLLSQIRDLHVQAVITSRPGEAHQLNFLEPNKYELGNYSDVEFPKAVSAYAAAFVTESQGRNAAQHARNLQAAASSGYPIEALARNPLALQLIYAVYAPQEINYAEINVVSLYRDYWERRVRSDFRPGSNNYQSRLDLTYAAEILGLAMLSEGMPELHQETVRNIFKKFGIDQECLGVLAERAVVIMFSSEAGMKVAFFHQTFFEHTAARAIVSLTGMEGLKELAARYFDSSENYFLGCVLERALVLTDFEPQSVVEAGEGIVMSLFERGSEANACGIYAYIHKLKASDHLRHLVQDLVASSDPIAVERLLELAPNMPTDRQLELLKSFAHLISGSDFRRGEQVVKGLSRISSINPEEVAEFLRKAKPQDGLLKDISGSALTRKAYYSLLDRIAPAAPDFVWGEMIRLFSDGLSRTAGESDGLACVSIVLNHYDIWTLTNVAKSFERDVERAIRGRRVHISNDLARGIAKIHLRDWTSNSVDPNEILGLLSGLKGSKREYFARLYGLSQYVIDHPSTTLWQFMQSSLRTPDQEILHYIIVITWANAFDELVSRNRANIEIKEIAANISLLPQERQEEIGKALIKMIGFSETPVELINYFDMDDANDAFSVWTNTRGLGRRLLDAADGEIDGARQTLNVLLSGPQKHHDRLRAVAVQARSKSLSEGGIRILSQLALAMHDPFTMFPSIEKVPKDSADWIDSPIELFQLAYDLDPRGNQSQVRDKARFFREFERLSLFTGLTVEDLFSFSQKQSDDIARAYVLQAVNYRLRNAGTTMGLSIKDFAKRNEVGFERSRAELIQCIATLFEMDTSLAERHFNDLLDLVFVSDPNSTHIAPVARPLYGLLNAKSDKVFGICEKLLEGLRTVSNATANGEYTRLARVFIIASQRADRNWTLKMLRLLKFLSPEVGRLLVGMLGSVNDALFEEIYTDIMQAENVPNATIKRVADLRRQRHRMLGVAPWPELLDLVNN